MGTSWQENLRIHESSGYSSSTSHQSLKRGSPFRLSVYLRSHFLSICRQSISRLCKWRLCDPACRSLVATLPPSPKSRTRFPPVLRMAACNPRISRLILSNRRIKKTPWLPLSKGDKSSIVTCLYLKQGFHVGGSLETTLVLSLRRAEEAFCSDWPG